MLELPDYCEFSADDIMRALPARPGTVLMLEKPTEAYLVSEVETAHKTVSLKPDTYKVEGTVTLHWRPCLEIEDTLALHDDNEYLIEGAIICSIKRPDLRYVVKFAQSDGFTTMRWGYLEY